MEQIIKEIELLEHRIDTVNNNKKTPQTRNNSMF